MTSEQGCVKLVSTMNINHNDKTLPMVENHNDTADIDRRLVEEINILKLEGSLFCFDPKEAKRRKGKLTLSDARKQPVTIFINPQFGQPAVLAYKVTQAIFLKIAETGCAISEDGRCLYNDTVSFSWRELAYLTGRTWSGRTSQQLFEALMQLQTTQVIATLYDKASDTWETVSFVLLPTVYFAGKGEKISRCSVQVHSKIVESVNRRHVATFNLNRLSTLDTIGLVLYKRIFFHFSNLMHESKRKGSLRFTKDYEAICKEWLGGLKPEKYKSLIISNQLGRHLEALKATGLISRSSVEANKAGDGFEHARNLGGGAALLEQALGQGDLLCAQLGGPAEAHTAPLGGCPPCPRPLLNQGPLELGDAGKDGEHHPPGGAGRAQTDCLNQSVSARGPAAAHKSMD